MIDVTGDTRTLKAAMDRTDGTGGGLGRTYDGTTRREIP
jgi:hypothetical protein